MRTALQIMREIVEPLRESWQRELATFELARLVRERAFDVGVEAHEVPLLRMVKKRPFCNSTTR